jgi:hypothetical protein
MLAACGSRLQSQAPSDGGVDAAQARDSAGDSRPEFSCPSSPPPDDSCFGVGSTCTYPCGGTSPYSQTFVCNGGTWRPQTHCEPPTTTPGTVGDACTTNAMCDTTGEGINYCSLGAFSGSSVYPSPVCLATCDDPAPELLKPCDSGRGICLSTGAAGVCVPPCSFGNDGAAPKGCLGRNMCWPLARASAAEWRGYCAGGCADDADCPTGNLCDPDRLNCVKSVPTAKKPLGAACDNTDASTAACVCPLGRTSGLGYCTRVCRVGETSCPTGYVCDPGLPDGDPALVPAAVGAYCRKVCATDSECVNSQCRQHAGMSTKTCSVD